MSRRILIIVILGCAASAFWVMRHCFNERPMGRSMTLLEASEKCLWCGVRIFERGILKADDSGAIYFNTPHYEIRLDSQIDIAGCSEEKVIVEGLLYQKPFDQQLYLTDIAYVQRDAFVSDKNCYVNRSHFGPSPDDN